MPGTQPNNDLWLAQQIAQLKRDIAALKAQRTQYITDASGHAQAIIGDIAHDPSGNSTGLSGFGVALWNGTSWVQAGDSLALGDFIPSGASARPGCLLCDGTAYTLTAHPELDPVATACPQYVAGGIFTVPNLKGAGLVGADPTGVHLPTLKPALGATVGEEDHVLSITEMPSHNHGGATGGMDRANPHAHNIPVATSGIGASAADGAVRSGTITSDATDINHLHGISAQGGGAAHNNVQPSHAVNWFIYTGA